METLRGVFLLACASALVFCVSGCSDDDPTSDPLRASILEGRWEVGWDVTQDDIRGEVGLKEYVWEIRVTGGLVSSLEYNVTEMQCSSGPNGPYPGFDDGEIDLQNTYTDDEGGCGFDVLVSAQGVYDTNTFSFTQTETYSFQDPNDPDCAAFNDPPGQRISTVTGQRNANADFPCQWP